MCTCGWACGARVENRANFSASSAIVTSDSTQKLTSHMSLSATTSRPPEHEPAQEPEARRTRRPWGVALLLAAAAGLAWFLWSSRTADGAEANAAAGPHKSDKPPSVRVMEIAPRPFAVVLEGLGTVTPLATVTVRPQVDGPLLSVEFQEGKRVRRGDVLAEIDSRPFRIRLSQARAAAARDRAQLDNAKRDLARYKSLSEQKLIAPQQLDAQQSLVDQLSASVAADEADVAEAQLQLQYTRIASPIDGVAGIRQVDPGNLVRASDANGIVVITQLDPIAVVFTLPQDRLSALAAAMSQSEPRVEVWSRDGSAVLGVGTLQVIDNQINTATASVRLKARFDNPERKLWPNQFVRARVTVAQREAALVVPAVAVQQGPQGAYVYVVTPDDRARLRPVEVALLQGEQAVLSQGVSAGERVVIQGQEQVKPDGPVHPIGAAQPSTDEAKEAAASRGKAGAAGAP